MVWIFCISLCVGVTLTFVLEHLQHQKETQFFQSPTQKAAFGAVDFGAGQAITAPLGPGMLLDPLIHPPPITGSSHQFLALSKTAAGAADLVPAALESAASVTCRRLLTAESALAMLRGGIELFD